MVVNIKTKLLLISLVFLPLFLFSNDISDEEYKQLGFKILTNEAQRYSNILNKKIKDCENLANNNLLDKNTLNNISLSKKELDYVLSYFYFHSLNECSKNERGNSYFAYMKLFNFMQKNFSKLEKLEEIQKSINILYVQSVSSLESKMFYDKYINKTTKNKLNKIKDLNQPFNIIKSLELMKKAN